MSYTNKQGKNMKVINKKNRGFTMIELIIVIAILGILSAFALPRFANFTSEAKAAARDGISSSLNSSIAIAHAKWIAQGSTGPVTLDGSASAITMNAAGYPDVGTTGVYKDATTCQTLVGNLVAGTNASSLTVAANAAGNCTVDSPKAWASPIVLTATTAN
jgi:MSHA pilin protein MshA